MADFHKQYEFPPYDSHSAPSPETPILPAQRTDSAPVVNSLGRPPPVQKLSPNEI